MIKDKKIYGLIKKPEGKIETSLDLKNYLVQHRDEVAKSAFVFYFKNL